MSRRDAGLFDQRLFREPPAFLWPGYFWMINDVMDEAKLLAQLRDMRRHDVRSVCLHPLPPEFHPDMFGSEMAPSYLGRAFFARLRRVVAECGRLGINYWLYDEGGWPSGSAAGQVYARDPVAHALKVLVFSETPMAADETCVVPRTAVCAAVRLRHAWKVFLPGQAIPAPGADTVRRIYYIQPRVFHYPIAGRNTPPYVDLLCRSAIETFLELTHARYRKHLGHAFGNTIRFVFLDEPSMMCALDDGHPLQLTWTPDFPRAFRRMKGYDLVPRLPNLLEPVRADDPADRVRLRVDYFDVRSRLFVERYLRPVRQWCRKNRLLSAGHFGGEYMPLANALGGYGHILRSLRALDLPGVDTIWRELFPGKRSHHFAKYASSVARQMGQPYVVTESFAVYGAGLTPAEMKWVIDQQYVRGVTLAVISNYPYSLRDQFMPFCRPHFGPTHPLWKHSAPFHAYVARLGYLLSRGRPACRTAVYYDIRGIWAGGRSRDQALALHGRIAEVLLKSQCDFDFIDDDLLAGHGARVVGGTLAVGPMRYGTIVVPATDWMDLKALQGLAEFVRSGGTLLAVEGAPRADGGARSLPGGLPLRGRVVKTRVADLPARIAPVVTLAPACPDIRATRRAWAGGAFYFLTNEARRTIRLEATFPETSAPLLCNPALGASCRLEGKQTRQGLKLALEFPPWGSKAILFEPHAAEAGGDVAPGPAFDPAHEIKLQTGWTLRPVKIYTVGERKYEVNDVAAQPRPCAPGDWRRDLGDWFSGDAEYAVAFQCPEALSRKPARLDLGDVRYACEVEINGLPAGRCLWEPFAVRLDNMLKPGKNVLKVRVTNTLANALNDPAVVERWKKKNGPGWPCYDNKARAFEADSLPSGLFGPVRIMY